MLGQLTLEAETAKESKGVINCRHVMEDNIETPATITTPEKNGMAASDIIILDSA